MCAAALRAGTGAWHLSRQALAPMLEGTQEIGAHGKLEEQCLMRLQTRNTAASVIAYEAGRLWSCMCTTFDAEVLYAEEKDNPPAVRHSTCMHMRDCHCTIAMMRLSRLQHAVMHLCLHCCSFMDVPKGTHPFLHLAIWPRASLRRHVTHRVECELAGMPSCCAMAAAAAWRCTSTAAAWLTSRRGTGCAMAARPACRPGSTAACCAPSRGAPCARWPALAL